MDRLLSILFKGRDSLLLFQYTFTSLIKWKAENRMMTVKQKRKKELAPQTRKYANLKKRVRGLDEMTFADLKASLDPDYNLETTYEEAAETVQDAVKVMSSGYSDMVSTAVSNRWIDFTDNAGVDMSNPDPIREAVSYVGELIAELEESYQ